MKRSHTFSSGETRKLGIGLGQKLLRSRLSRYALVVALRGELGSGKTVFAGGVMKGLGLRARAMSPTFILMRHFSLRRGPFKNVYHFDCYRIKKPRELLALGLKEILSDPKNIVLIEWAERVHRILPKHTCWIQFSHGSKEHERAIRF